ncbi:hypothetical protein PG999_008612 [Apiospora kogelbergensis]|uniref:Heterokaryon incompatibility domain-containing protein n=1 Tax=Apiospora kogelbergensis TaxID=1337665 RepID=A0AAW0QL02_9PEZI
MDNDGSTNDDDKGQSLHELSLHHGASIVSQLVDIGSRHNQQPHEKFLPIIRRLQCLSPRGTKLFRGQINAFDKQEYIALSYTWKSSEHEDPKSGKYQVEGWDSQGLKSSAVRDCVFDRILSYMRYAQVQLLWIDAHCIRQDECDGDTCAHHSRCTEKRDALQAMDLVYQLSSHPVALLGRPMQETSELHLLKLIMTGKLVAKSDNGSESPFWKPTELGEAIRALRLLHDITQDLWWRRAWTFQENYRGGRPMRLLIPYTSSLESPKRCLKGFGKMPGELCIKSVSFSTEATYICLALNRVKRKLLPDDIQRIKDVLRAAGRYAAILPASSPMTPTVVTDIEERGLSNPWDRLAILANCCQYSTRLDVEALKQQNRSLSLSVLAMCSLNGEILDNSDDSRTSTAPLTVSHFLRQYLFKGFSAPENDTRPLTFNKGCRLTDVELTTDGISTKGHLWKLGRVIDTSEFPRKLPWINNPRGRLTMDDRRRLLQLFLYLKKQNHRFLADQINIYLTHDAYRAGKNYATFTEMYLHHMAIELAVAINSGRKLRLGSIWDSKRRKSEYRAIFMWPDENEGDLSPPPAFVFTSAWFRNPGSDAHEPNDIDRHVSLEVSLEEPRVGTGVPHLRVRTWRLGMCFFEDCRLTGVVFPWPRALRDIKL